MVRVRVVGIAGRAGAGKNTAARRLAELAEAHPDLRVTVTEASFAAPLKEALAPLFGITPEYFSERSLKEAPHPFWAPHTPRSLCQWLGTEVLRDQFDPDFILRRMDLTLREIIDAHAHFDDSMTVLVAVTDVRFPDEARRVLERSDARLLFVNADGRLGKFSGASAHRSERAVDETRAMLRREGLAFEEVDNNGAPEALTEPLLAVLRAVAA